MAGLSVILVELVVFAVCLQSHEGFICMAALGNLAHALSVKERVPF